MHRFQESEAAAGEFLRPGMRPFRRQPACFMTGRLQGSRSVSNRRAVPLGYSMEQIWPHRLPVCRATYSRQAGPQGSVWIWIDNAGRWGGADAVMQQNRQPTTTYHRAKKRARDVPSCPVYRRSCPNETLANTSEHAALAKHPDGAPLPEVAEAQKQLRINVLDSNPEPPRRPAPGVCSKPTVPRWLV
jgi:hypothetical protein